MKFKKIITVFSFLLLITCIFSFRNISSNNYFLFYRQQINDFLASENLLADKVKNVSLSAPKDLENLKIAIHSTRLKLKSIDFWLRYLEPLAYKKINSPLLVEWETEVFEKHEKPYKRIGAGLTLAELYLEEENIQRDSLLFLISESQRATNIYLQDSITKNIKTFDHFYFCNRLYLLNLASIYTTGFECPDTSEVIPELKHMLGSIQQLYQVYNESFPDQALNVEYLNIYKSCIEFVNTQDNSYSHFNHFQFIRDYVNPLFQLNQNLLLLFNAHSNNNLDYALNKSAISIFDKNLYNGQNTKGIFLRVTTDEDLALLDHLGKHLFHDPILSVNNKRSCVSCHNPDEYFTDTIHKTSLQLNEKDFLTRNTPSLINAQYNHLSMVDGKFHTLQHQGKSVITNPIEMGSNEKEVLVKVLAIKEYSKGFKKLLKYTPQEKNITLEHLVSAISFYYGKFGKFNAPFDESMNKKEEVSSQAIQGFNLFMSKSQCATCHFVPQFNGVKPPYIGSEFEVLGTPDDIHYKKLSADKGRYDVNPADETLNAFRTGSLRNIEKTKPYMHNGVFKTLDDVLEFYNGGGGAGRGLSVSNQTLSSDSLHLSKTDKENLLCFLKSLNEKIVFEPRPIPFKR